jgi:hypothetical protein
MTGFQLLTLPQKIALAGGVATIFQKALPQ